MLLFSKRKPGTFISLACLVKEVYILLDGSVLLSISIPSLACDHVFRNAFPMTKTIAQLGLVVYLLAGRWNGNHPPAMVQMNDVMFGLIMTSPLRRLYIVVFYFPL